MKVKLLKRLRKRAYLIKYGNYYKAYFKTTFFTALSSPFLETRKKAENRLRDYIITSARFRFKRPKIKMYLKSKKKTTKPQSNI